MHFNYSWNFLQLLIFCKWNDFLDTGWPGWVFLPNSADSFLETVVVLWKCKVQPEQSGSASFFYCNIIATNLRFVLLQIESNAADGVDGSYKWWYSVMVKLYWVEDKWGITGHPSMRANATRFTPESITAKLNFTCIDYWRHASKIKIYHKCHIYIFTQPCWVYTSHQSSAWRWL